MELPKTILKSGGEEIATNYLASGIEKVGQSRFGAGGEPEESVGFFLGNDFVELFDSALIFESLEVFSTENHGDWSSKGQCDQVDQSQIVEVQGQIVTKESD